MIVTLFQDKVVYKLLVFMIFVKGRGYAFNDFKTHLKLSNISIYKALSKLEFYGIINKKGVVYKLDLSNEYTKYVCSIIEEDLKRFEGLEQRVILILLEFLSLIDTISSIKQIIIFGSYAKRTQTIHSDIDIAIISSTFVDVFEFAYKIEEKYGVHLEIHNFTVKDFSSSTLIKEIKRDGIFIK
ncbi:MAG: nucleotidyltransferase domain-containing protein [Nanoarchaeota archaeon]|nr:nucleotidyltransferase domain-containing protein [Nanoarchaeota archaeon]